MTPLHYPEQYPEGPWGVESEGRSWYVRDRRTGRNKALVTQ